MINKIRIAHFCLTLSINQLEVLTLYHACFSSDTKCRYVKLNCPFADSGDRNP